MSAAEDVVASFRSDTHDTELPYLWSDDDAYSYLSDAYQQYVRLIGGVPDFFSDELLVAVTTDEREVDIHSSILRVISVTRLSDNAPVVVLNMEDAASSPTYWEDYGLARSDLTANLPGEVTHIVLGLGVDKALLVNTPEADDTLQMYVMRMPLDTVVDDGHSLSDIPVRHHPALVLWVKHRAYSKQDADAYDPKAAEAFALQFNGYCAAVKAEIERQKSKVRVVVYGGI